MGSPPDPGAALLILLASLCTLIVGINVFYRGWVQRAQVTRRAQHETGQNAVRSLRGSLERRLGRTGWGARLAASLTAAGEDLRLVDFLAVVALSTLAGFFLTRMLFPAWLALAAAVGCVYACWLWVERKRAQRHERFLAQLPEIARVLSNASSAGLSLRSALELAVGDLAEPARTELARVCEELRIGQSTDGALENLGRRLPSREVGLLVATLVIQQRAGGDLIRSLRNMAATLEARKDLKREVKTIIAGSVFTSYIVAGLAVGCLFLLNAISPGVLDDMASRTGGRIALLIGGSLFAAGFVLIRRTTRIET